MCLVLSPLDKLLNYMNYAGLLSQTFLFYESVKLGHIRNTVIERLGEFRAGGSGWSKQCPTSKPLLMAMQPGMRILYAGHNMSCSKYSITTGTVFQKLMFNGTSATIISSIIDYPNYLVSNSIWNSDICSSMASFSSRTSLEQSSASPSLVTILCKDSCGSTSSCLF